MSDITLPLISIIIPTRNEEKYIGKLLDSLVEQTYPTDKFEVFIIDGMSKDRTKKIVEIYKDRLNLRIFTNPKIRSVYAFNKGIEKANGEFFMIVGAHSFVNENFIEEAIKTYFKIIKKEPMLASVGGINFIKPENILGELINLIYSSFFSGGYAQINYIKKPQFSDDVKFGLYNKKIVLEVGKFDEDFFGAGQDYELSLRLLKKGYKLFTNPEIVSHYYPRNSLKSFIKQTYNYGIAKGFTVRKGYYNIKWLNPASYWFIPASLIFYEIYILLHKIYFNSQVSLILIPLIIYWIINIIISLNLLIKTKKILCIFLPATYFIFHNILGISSLLGLIFGKKSFV